ncbi:hypothetical protein MKW94_024373 [Papaver nudicaule]|uniref:MADS-box domain-containing protein n=1 Tax=Papaver nudicaule TaxID=74823 RepID=A0AA41RWL3_PAPNU|nr:hypothetical protein [Papaver nudicaule]
MGRKRIDIEKIDDTNKRMVTFSKRRNGIMSKAEKLCKLCAEIVICIIVFSPAGKPFTFTNSPLGVCDIAERFVEEQAKEKKQGDKNTNKTKNSTLCGNKAGVVRSGTDAYWWDNIDMDKLDSVEKLKAMKETLANLKQNLIARKEKLTASSPLSSSSSTIDDTPMEVINVEDDTAITEEHQTRETSSEANPTNIAEEHETRETSSEANPATIAEKHQTRETSSEANPATIAEEQLDLNLYLGWR